MVMCKCSPVLRPVRAAALHRVEQDEPDGGAGENRAGAKAAGGI